MASLGSGNDHIVRYFGAWLEYDHLYIQLELCETSLVGGVAMTSTRPTLCSDESSPRVCISVHAEDKSCGLVRSWFECLFSMTLLSGGHRAAVHAGGGLAGGGPALHGVRRAGGHGGMVRCILLATSSTA